MVVEFARASSKVAHQESAQASAADATLQEVMMLLPHFRHAIGTTEDARRQRELLIREVDRLCQEWGGI